MSGLALPHLKNDWYFKEIEKSLKTRTQTDLIDLYRDSKEYHDVLTKEIIDFPLIKRIFANKNTYGKSRSRCYEYFGF